MKHAWLLLLFACGGQPPTPEPTGTPDHEPVPEEMGATIPCNTHASCASCVAGGCRWSAGHCDVACRQDVPCHHDDIACPTAEAGLIGAWKQDHAQSADGVDVFVRGDVELPPARFRQHWTFEPGGVLRASTLAANDAHGTVEGRWHLRDERHLVLELPGEGSQVFEIVALGDALRVRRAD